MPVFHQGYSATQNYKNLWDLYINNSAVNPADLLPAAFAADEFGKEQAVFYQNGSRVGQAHRYRRRSVANSHDPVLRGRALPPENCWANAKVSEEDIQATPEFMNWMVTDVRQIYPFLKSTGYTPTTITIVSTALILLSPR